MKKQALDLRVSSVDHLGEHHVLLKLAAPQGELPAMKPGQFVQVRVEGSSSTFLRRPISVNYVDQQRHELWLLVQMKGEGTCRLAALSAGDLLNVLLPLGNSFSLPQRGEKMLLIGGGVGVAPMLYLGRTLHEVGTTPTYLLGARDKSSLLERELFEQSGRLFVTTEDGSAGEKGFVTQHSILKEEHFDRFAVCGPKPMMMAVARYAKANGIDCEVSLENMMACGLGACLCCVEKTVRGNVCVCSEGPVFNINQLLWQI